MKKYILFLLSFILIFEVLQVFSGMFLTMLYTPSTSSFDKALPSHVVFGSSSIMPSLIIALLALGIAFGMTKVFVRKTN